VQTKLGNILRVPLLFAAFIIMGLTFGYITFNILSFSRTVEVPQITGITLLEANGALSRTGLYLKIEGEDYDPAIAAGKIIRQDIPAGNKIKEKRAIKVVVSKGSRVSSIPFLVNETLNNAEAALLQQGLRIGKIINVHSDSEEKGKIIAQRPEPDEIPAGPITVLVSMGSHELTYYCPDFLNKDIESGKDIAGKIGLVVETKGQGNIIAGQKPKPGTLIKSGDNIFFDMKEENAHD
jgi:beta-lactam-binding protein with PASTA domain